MHRSVGGGRRARLQIHARATALSTASAGALTVDRRVGAGSFAQDVTLVQKRGALVGS